MSEQIKTVEKLNSRTKDLLFIGALAIAGAAFPVAGSLAGHTPAERVHSQELLKAEGLIGLGALEVVGFKKMANAGGEYIQRESQPQNIYYDPAQSQYSQAELRLK